MADLKVLGRQEVSALVLAIRPNRDPNKKTALDLQVLGGQPETVWIHPSEVEMNKLKVGGPVVVDCEFKPHSTVEESRKGANGHTYTDSVQLFKCRTFLQLANRVPKDDAA